MRRKRASFRFKASSRKRRLGKKMALGEVTDWGPTKMASFFVGQTRGNESKNSSGRCAVAPRHYTMAQITRAFFALRLLQVGKHRVGMTATSGKGWYKGQPEDAVRIDVIHDGTDPDEGTFRKRMNAIAEKLAKDLCQDSVVVVHDDSSHRRSYGASW